ncbi:MAG: hypothetical protein ACYTXA_09295 [Nostoc sp.]
MTTPTTSLRDATRTLLLYERLRQRRRSVQVSTSAQCPNLRLSGCSIHLEPLRERLRLMC